MIKLHLICPREMVVYSRLVSFPKCFLILGVSFVLKILASHGLIRLFKFNLLGKNGNLYCTPLLGRMPKDIVVFSFDKTSYQVYLHGWVESTMTRHHPYRFRVKTDFMWVSVSVAKVRRICISTSDMKNVLQSLSLFASLLLFCSKLVIVWTEKGLRNFSPWIIQNHLRVSLQ